MSLYASYVSNHPENTRALIQRSQKVLYYKSTLSAPL